MEGGAAVVQYETSAGDHFQVVEGGRLVAWEEGSYGDPDLSLSLTEADADAFFGGENDATVLERITLRRRLPDGSNSAVLLPPFDEFDNPIVRALPPIPHADLTFCLHLSSTPIGDLHVTQVFRRGTLAGWCWGDEDGAQVRVSLPYERYCRFRAGEVTALDALAAGQISGEWSDVMLTDGLVEREERLRALRDASSPRALSALGLLTALLTAAREP